MKFIAIGFAVALYFAAAPASAHGGRTNASGCHNERATGGYHCHGSGRPPSLPVAPRPPVSGAFRNCAEARAAGAAPVRAGDPGYAPHLDRDRDGVGCE